MARNYSLPAFIALLAIIQATMSAATSPIPEAKDFFAKSIEGNLTKITWAHAVNSQAKLQEVIANEKIMMLEADVVMGILNDTSGNSSQMKVPILAHPPANESDLSLQQFLETVMLDGKHGIKLDFKSLDAFIASRTILNSYKDNLTFPVWLNADILVGPVDADKGDAKPVDAEPFISNATSTLPQSTLSIGWTTRYGAKYDITKGSYTQDQIQKMVAAVKHTQGDQTVTYPVRAGLAANSASVLSNLLKDTTKNKPTLTIWSSEGDVVDYAALSTLIKDIGVDKVYVDVPEDVMNKLDLKSAATSIATSSMMLVGSVIASLAIAKLV